MYILFYIVISMLVLIIGRFVNKNNSRNLKIIILMAILYGFLSSCLPYTISDRFYYALHFEDGIWAHMYSIEDLLSQNKSEYGYAFFCYALRRINSDPKFFFFSVSCIANFCAIYSIYISKYNFQHSLFLFVCSWYPFLTLYSCRQMLAVGFICLAVVLFERHSRKFALFYFSLACLFHATSMVCILLFLLSVFVTYKYSHAIVFGIAIFLSFAITPLMDFIINNIIYLQGKFLGSVEIVNMSNLIALKMLPYFVLTIGAIIEYNMIKQRDSHVDLLLIFTAFGCAAYVAALNLYWIYRMSFYCIIPAIFLMNDMYGKKHFSYKINFFYLLSFLINESILIREIGMFFINYL